MVVRPVYKMTRIGGSIMLRDEIQQRKPFAHTEEEAFLNLQRTAGLLMQSLTHTLKPHRLTPTQYNVLRILRGSYPKSLTCGEIGSRMVTPEPDVTRLIDRLVKGDLVERQRDASDRRVVRVAIVEAGLSVLSTLDEPINTWMTDLLGHLGEDQLQTLSHLLERARERLV